MNNQQNGPRQATTIAGYLEHVEEIKKQWSYPVLVFRGQENEDWPLESAAERRLKKNANSEGRVADDRFIEYHRDLINKCKLKNYDKREGKQLEELEILADLRHHGGAVCLIDFTHNALVALWFACENSDKDGNVFVVNTADKKTFLKIASTDIEDSKVEDILQFRTRKTGTDKDQRVKSREQRTFVPPSQDKQNFWYWTPAHLNERITAQHSLFVFGLPSSNEPNSKKIIIESKNKDKIRQDLKEIHDIYEESLFPDFVGFAYTYRIDAPYEIPDAEEYVRRGLEAQQQGEFDHAIQDYSETIKLNPHFADAYNNRGNAYSDTGEFDHAIQDYNKAIELKSDYAEAYYNRGIAYCKRGAAHSDRGDLDQAVQDFDKALELIPYFVMAYDYRGIAYYNHGIVGLILSEWEKARADLTTAKNTGVDIADFFRADHKSVADFEREYDLELPEDIADMLTGETV